MKNISRRVFIKGLAVAGVAAAASTVLAGCNTNMIPGVDDGSEDEGTETPTNQKITLTDTGADKSMTIEVTNFQYVENANYAILSLHLDNQLEQDVSFGTTANTYNLAITYETIDSLNNKDANAAESDDTLGGTDNALGSTKLTVGSETTEDAKIYINMPEAKEWEKLNVILTLTKKGATNGTVVAVDKFTFNK